MNHAEQIDDEANGLPKREVAQDGPPLCAACRSARGVRFDPKLPGVLFCADCWRQAKDSSAPYEDLGVGD